jgi:leucyl/phenylalanyl-tRNA--protein transferase
MPVFYLNDRIIFPPSNYADPDGLLAVGGDLSPERLLLAYRLGIFPWYSANSPILWWSPDPRLVLFPHELKVSRSLERVIRKNRFKVTFDQVFGQVIERCATARRKHENGTWIIPEIMEAYCRLHELGYAHSVETWYEGELVGESMFMQKTDASKVALVHLARQLADWEFQLIDCQMTTSHLIHFGAREIPRREFLELLSKAIEDPADKGPWSVFSGKRTPERS